MSGYPYAAPGLLREPCLYMYPPFGGADFLRAWAEQRGQARAELARALEHAPPATALPGLCLALLESFAGPQPEAEVLRRAPAAASGPAPELPSPADSARSAGGEGALELEPLLRALLLRAALGLPGAADALWLPLLARKFEVAKRLFPAYAPHPRHGLGAPLDPDAANRDIGLHALLAAALGLCPGRDTDLRLLNAQLKLNDVLASEVPALRELPEAAALALLSLRAEAWRAARLSPEGSPWL